MGFQQQDSRLQGQRPLWLSPERDLSVQFTVYVYKALILTQTEYEKAYKSVEPDDKKMESLLKRKLDRFCEFAVTLAEYTNGCTGEGSAGSVNELVERVNLLRPEFEDVWADFGKWFTRTVMGAYFKGIRTATMKGETPITIEDLRDQVKEFVGENQLGEPWKEKEGGTEASG